MHKRVLKLDKAKENIFITFKFKIQQTHPLNKEQNHCLDFTLTHFVSGPLNGVLNDRRERLEGAEWDLLFRGVPL